MSKSCIIRPMSFHYLFGLIFILIKLGREGTAQSFDSVSDAQIVAEGCSQIFAKQRLAS